MKTLTTFQSYSGGLSADLGEDRNVFVWNACSGEYSSNGSGTFNINVPDGISGIYIRDITLDACIDEKIRNSLSRVESAIDDILD